MAVTKEAKAAPTPQKGAGATRRPAAEESEPSMDRGAMFDQTKALGAITPGKYEAIITELELQKEDEKGQSVRIKYEIATPGEMQGESLAQWYKVFETDGHPGKGAAFLKKDLAVLGYPDVRFADLEEVFEEIVEKQLGAVITVKQNEQFTNAYLNGLAEGSDIIDEYLEKRGF
jgi:hypothetical protein